MVEDHDEPEPEDEPTLVQFHRMMKEQSATENPKAEVTEIVASHPK